MLIYFTVFNSFKFIIDVTTRTLVGLNILTVIFFFATTTRFILKIRVNDKTTYIYILRIDFILTTNSFST